MKIIIRIFINLFLVLAMLISLAFSNPYAGPLINLILSALILAIIIAYNVKVGAKYNRRTKTIILITLSLGCLAYLAIPKKNSACGAVATATGVAAACSSSYCVGLPITAMVNPICFGYAFGEKNWTE